MQDKRQIKRTIRRLLPEIKKGGMNILDIGTGEGTFLDMCNIYGNKCTGVENDLENFGIALKGGRNVFFENALNMFYSDGQLFGDEKFDIVNLEFCLCLIFSRHCKFDNKKLCWNYSCEMINDFDAMAIFMKKILNENGIVLIKSHNTKCANEYSEAILNIFRNNDFELVKNKRNITHKFRKLNAN
jgi:hypothetical protein